MSSMSQCAERAGFLFKHRCDRMGQRDCQQCGKKICQHHTVTTSLAEDSSKSLLSNSVLVCTSCAKRIGRRISDSGAYADPYYYGHSHYHGWGRHRSSGSSTHQSSDSSTPPPLPGGASDETPAFDPATPPSLPGDAPDETLAYDPNDLTEADGAATEIPGDEGFETDMEGS